MPLRDCLQGVCRFPGTLNTLLDQVLGSPKGFPLLYYLFYRLTGMGGVWRYYLIPCYNE